MPASEMTDSAPVAVDAPERLRVDCYVRSTVPMAVTETIETTIERLQRLYDDGPLADCQINHWPSERHAATRVDDEQSSSRSELVDEFERWAAQQGYSLEPAFRREVTPPSQLGVGPTESRERVRVPLVALALYEDMETTTSSTETESLQGVVPYTAETPTGETRTYTVDEWLSAVETGGWESSSQTPSDDQPPVLEGQQ